MRPRERVIKTIRHEQADRTPIYGWVEANLKGPITEAFGSVEAFEDHYEFDFAHLFGGPPTFGGEDLEELRTSLGRDLDPRAALDLAPTDPNDRGAYDDIAGKVRHHKEKRDRFVYVQTPGIFEALNTGEGIYGDLHSIGEP